MQHRVRRSERYAWSRHDDSGPRVNELVGLQYKVNLGLIGTNKVTLALGIFAMVFPVLADLTGKVLYVCLAIRGSSSRSRDASR